MSSFCLTLAGVAGLAVAQEPLVRSDRQVELRFHAAGLEEALARGLADAAWAAMLDCKTQLKTLGVLPRTAMVVELWADPVAFGELVTASGARFPVEEFADPAKAIANVLLRPALKPEQLAVIGLPTATREAIVRQLAWVAAAQSELGAKDPMLCRIVAAGMLDRLDNPKSEPGVSLGFDARRRIIRNTVDYGRLPAVAQEVSTASEPVNLFGWDFTWEVAGWYAQVLHARSSSWGKKLLTPNAAAKKATSVVEVRRAQLAAWFGGDWSKFEAELENLVDAPFDGWATQSPEAELRDGRIRMAGSAAEPARVLCYAKPPQTPFALRCGLELSPVGEGEVRVGFLAEERVFAVIFRRGECSAETWDGKQRSVLGRHIYSEQKLDQALAVEITEVMRVRVDGELVMTLPLGDFPMRERIGVSCYDSIAWLRDLRVEPLVVGGR